MSFATSGDIATAGADFTGVSGTLTFNPGEVVKIVPVNVIDDAAIETRERFFFTLTNPSGGQIAQSRATVTVFDNDAAAVTRSSPSRTSGSAKARTTRPSPSACRRGRPCRCR